MVVVPIFCTYDITWQQKPANLQLCGVVAPSVCLNIFMWYNCFLSVSDALLLQMSPIQFCLSSAFLPTMH